MGTYDKDAVEPLFLIDKDDKQGYLIVGSSQSQLFHCEAMYCDNKVTIEIIPFEKVTFDEQKLKLLLSRLIQILSPWFNTKE